jgi:adenine-specific DNA methylase
MGQPYSKRLIEVDLPIKRISAHARREKSVRHGHISTLHIWWARRPLAACRAVVCAALWPDPADELCPKSFRDAAKTLMADWARDQLGRCGAESYERFTAIQRNPEALSDGYELRGALLDFLADFANWDNSVSHEYLETSRRLTSAAHLGLGGIPGSRPVVVDPFAGGGSIPLEALRVGADAFASDLNPVATLLNKVLLEYVPKFGERLAEEVQRWGVWVSEKVREELGEFYPEDRDGGRANAYIWARTVLSEAPGEDDIPVEVPLIRSLLLLNKRERMQALRWTRDPSGQIKTTVDVAHYADGREIQVRRPVMEVFQPRYREEVGKGTSTGGAATCPVTGFTMSVESVRRQLMARQGGAADARLLCVVKTKAHVAGKVYSLPTAREHAAAHRAKQELARRIADHHERMALVPDGQINHLRGFFNVVLYGMSHWGDLFTPRQALALTTLASLVRTAPISVEDEKLRVAVRTCLALVLDRCADKCANLVVWDNTRDMATHVFGRQALPMIWDFAEVNILAENGWDGALEWVRKVIEATARAGLSPGVAAQASATEHPLPDDTADAVVTDPPYYAAIPYADLSDFFYSWLQRSVGAIHTDLFKEKLSPKNEECVSLAHRAAMYRQKDSAWFEKMMTRACEESRRVCKESGIAVVVFANKETAGWEAMLNALVSSSWIITASWPIDTEMSNRLRAQDSAVLGSSVHLVCRPRGEQESAAVGDWRDVLEELPRRIHDWMPRLAEEGIVGADAIFACLGPALEIFSRYEHVEKASGELVSLNEYLEQVWAAVAREALTMVFEGADATGFEPDARLTAMWLWTLKAGGNGGKLTKHDEQDGENESYEEEPNRKTPGLRGFVLEYDAARKIAQGLGAHLEGLRSIVEIRGARARLVAVAERTNHLFGKDEEESPQRDRKKRALQADLFSVLSEGGLGETAWPDHSAPRIDATTLDRLHQSMILFGAGRGEALKRFLVAEGVGQDARFWRLAQSLSALFPISTDEKRWVDGVLARKKGLGL